MTNETTHEFNPRGSLADGCQKCRLSFTSVTRYGLECRTYSERELIALDQLLIAECDAQPWRIMQSETYTAALLGMALAHEVATLIEKSLPKSCAFCDDAVEVENDGCWSCRGCANRRGLGGRTVAEFVESFFKIAEAA